MHVLIYKRTHNGDPDQNGCFGIEDCMGSVRAREFDAVVGVGGIGPEARRNGIAGRINWIGIGPHKVTKPSKRGPVVTFDHFLDFGSEGPDFQEFAPTLAKRMYSVKARHVMDGLDEEEYREALKIVRLAEDEAPSPARAARPSGASRYIRSEATARTRQCGNRSRC
jgi:hypothetical protein